MASVSSSHLILFIASLLIAASVAGTFTQGVQRLSSALGDRSLDVAQDVRTDVEIISDPGSPEAIYDDGTDGDDGNITILVKNTGSLDLPADNDQIEVLVDGRYQVDVEVNVRGGDSWRVGDVVELRISETLDSGDHRATVIVNGDEETFEFRLQL